MVFELGFAHHELAAGFLSELSLLHAQRAQPFGAAALHELEVVGIEHDAAGVGVLPIHADRKRVAHRAGFAIMARRRSMDSSRCAIELAVEKRTNLPVSAVPKSRPGVTATWARFMVS